MSQRILQPCFLPGSLRINPQVIHYRYRLINSKAINSPHIRIFFWILKKNIDIRKIINEYPFIYSEPCKNPYFYIKYLFFYYIIYKYAIFSMLKLYSSVVFADFPSPMFPGRK